MVLHIREQFAQFKLQSLEHGWQRVENSLELVAVLFHIQILAHFVHHFSKQAIGSELIKLDLIFQTRHQMVNRDSQLFWQIDSQELRRFEVQPVDFQVQQSKFSLISTQDAQTSTEQGRISH